MYVPCAGGAVVPLHALVQSAWMESTASFGGLEVLFGSYSVGGSQKLDGNYMEQHGNYIPFVHGPWTFNMEGSGLLVLGPTLCSKGSHL